MKDNPKEILLITSYPPRECGIATFSQDLLVALNNKFEQTFTMRVCALESAQKTNVYPPEVKFVLHTSSKPSYEALIQQINADQDIRLVLLQHEFGFFGDIPADDFSYFLEQIKKPLVLTFHTVLPNPDQQLLIQLQQMAAACHSIIVMTQNAARVLIQQYDIPEEMIFVIAHGIHLVPHLGKTALKQKYGLSGRKVLSTFGLISSGKSIETTLDALPAIVAKHPNVLFLAIGKTHPSVVSHEGEQYRQMLEAKVKTLSLEEHVRFINAYLPLPTLLEYLQLTDIYLFTSKDPAQAVSGTFSYAVSCGCAIISTPIPHAREVLRDDAGLLFDFQNASQLGTAVNRLLDDNKLRKRIISNGLQRVIFAAWENTAIAYAMLFKQIVPDIDTLHYELPEIKLDHLKRMTTSFGIIQFSVVNRPDPDSGYTLDDNARALVAVCMHYQHTHDKTDLRYLNIYLDFIAFCQQQDGSFLNYIDFDHVFTRQNHEVNLDDANGRAIWALGHLIAARPFLPARLVARAEMILEQTLTHVSSIHSTRAMAFIIKGLYFAWQTDASPMKFQIIKKLSDRLVQMYQHENEEDWHWYEGYLTYGNSIVPEAMLCAWLATRNPVYEQIAVESFGFLLEHTFTSTGIKTISNDGWMKKGSVKALYGEQPIDIAYTILALERFYHTFGRANYREQSIIAFNWFLGQNHLNQIIYNPCTGGCYDGLEKTQVNMNQGAESTVSYLMARIAMAQVSIPVEADALA